MNPCFLFLLLLGAQGCSFLKERSPEHPWALTGLRPKRLVVLVLEDSPPELKLPTPSPHFDSLKNQSLQFTNAWIGHLVTHPKLSFSVLLSGLLPKHLPQAKSDSSWISEIPGGPNHQKILKRPLQEPASQAVIRFFQSDPQWTALLTSIPQENALLELGKILSYLETSQDLSETLLLVTSEQGQLSPGKVYTEPTTLPASLRGIIKTEWKKIEADNSLRIYLAQPDNTQALKLASQLKKMPGISEIFYQTRLSGRYHYIRTYRSSSLSPEELEWNKNHTPFLLQSVAGPKAPDVIAFLKQDSLSQESFQKIPLWIWSSNLRLNNPVIKNQMEQTPVKLIDIGPIVLEMMGLSPKGQLDGTSLGISSVLVDSRDMKPE